MEEGVEDEVGFDGEHPKIKCPNMFNKLFFVMQSIASIFCDPELSQLVEKHQVVMMRRRA